ncbi:PGR5-like protein 1B, chloroplastic [Salvia hispanica]|uniref:PGR5-like protein 1B, chloroplastic n=1 Tax=Salvia hispanica TaxID=49212 RepID=UPI00200924A0|nr:PGR5-like protein 1B, chloroplastic [Salvia hispanica]
MATGLTFHATKPLFLTTHFTNLSYVNVPTSALAPPRKPSLKRNLAVKATTDPSGQVEKDEIDEKPKRTVGEMEQEFLQALQAFYYEGKSIMSNEEFDNLKEELMWEGSSVVMLSADEQRFLEASIAYVSGNPLLSDKEFDELKQRLKADGSEIVIEGPRCSLRSRKVYSDLSVDYLKMYLLNAPATIVALGLFFFIDEITGFEVVKIPEPFGFLVTWFAALPFIIWLAFTLTNAVVKDVLILEGICPNCGTKNNSFFGSILSISSGGSTNNVKCSNCGTALVYDSKTRLITLPE